jgi:transposase-like protein
MKAESRSGRYGRTPAARMGRLEQRVPQDRVGRFKAEVFERRRRSERALVTVLGIPQVKELDLP